MGLNLGIVVAQGEMPTIPGFENDYRPIGDDVGDYGYIDFDPDFERSTSDYQPIAEDEADYEEAEQEDYDEEDDYDYQDSDNELEGVVEEGKNTTIILASVAGAMALCMILMCVVKRRKSLSVSAGKKDGKDVIDYEAYDSEDEEEILLRDLDSEVDVRVLHGPALPAKDY